MAVTSAALLLLLLQVPPHLQWRHNIAQQNAVNGPAGLRQMYLGDGAAQHKAESCDLDFGVEAWQRWNATAKVLAQCRGGEPCLICRVTALPEQPRATLPHTLCDAYGLVLDRARVIPANCPQFRPGYRCDSPTFHHYAAAAFTLPRCRLSDRFSTAMFPADHLRDIFSSLACGPASAHAHASVHASAHASLQRDGVTLFVTREHGEHLNLFHAMTDFLNAFSVAILFNLDLQRTSVVLLDHHSESPFDSLWSKAFSRHRPLERVRDYPADARLRFQHSIFVPPGYSSLLYRRLDVDTNCKTGPEGVRLYTAFAQHVLASYGIEWRRKTSRSTLKVLVVLRKPFQNQHIDHMFTGRQVANEDEFLEAVASFEGVIVTSAEMSTLTFEQQLRLVSESDVLVGMHGAALSHAIFLPLNGGLFELMPKPDLGWRCFKHMAQLSGLVYGEWFNRLFPKANYREDAHGDYTTVDLPEFKAEMEKLLNEVRRRQHHF